MTGARKAGQAATACLVMMTKGDLTSITLKHWLVACKTGGAGALIAVILTFTPLAKAYANKWGIAAIAGVSTVFADWWSHSMARAWHAPTKEALLTGVGAFVLSLVVSMTPIGARIEALAAKLKDPEPPKDAPTKPTEKDAANDRS